MNMSPSYESFALETQEDEDNGISEDEEEEDDNVNSCCASWSIQTLGSSDILVASWLFLLSSLCWGFMAIDLLVTESKVPRRVSIEQWIQLIAAALFTLGSLFLVEGAHPVYMAGPKARIISRQRASSKVSPHSNNHSYFTQTDVKIASLLFFICAIPFFILGMYSIITDPRSSFGYVYLIGSVISILAMGVWALGGTSHTSSDSHPKKLLHCIPPLFFPHPSLYTFYFLT